MLYVEGANVGTSQGAVMNAYTTAMNDLAFMEISSQHIIDGYDITIQAEITPMFLRKTLEHMLLLLKSLQPVMLEAMEKTSFKHVMMKIFTGC